MREKQPIAQALSLVEGVRGFAYRPVAAKVGDAWPSWRGLETVTDGAFRNTWTVIVLVPVDERARDEWIDERLQAIIDAVSGILWVQNVEAGESSETPAMLINCVGE